MAVFLVIMVPVDVLFLFLSLWRIRILYNFSRLRFRGIECDGACEGYVGVREGVCVVLGYTGPDGRKYRLTTDVWVGVLPNVGKDVVVLVCLPFDPGVAALWPIDGRKLAARSASAAFMAVVTVGLIWLTVGPLGVNAI